MYGLDVRSNSHGNETTKLGRLENDDAVGTPPKSNGQAGEYFVRAIETNDTLTLVDLHLGGRKNVEDFRPKKNERGGISAWKYSPKGNSEKPFTYKSHQFFGLQNYKNVSFLRENTVPPWKMDGLEVISFYTKKTATNTNFTHFWHWKKNSKKQK